MTESFYSVTLGCKLNQFDTAAIEGTLTRRGLRAEADPALAGVVIVNTCTVTGKADTEARRRIRSLRRGNPRCRLLVTGCYAEREAERLRRMEGVDHVFGNREKHDLEALLDAWGIGVSEAARSTPVDRGCDAALDLPPTLHFGDRTRAFLKVQEGCRLACSYCVIPAVRGPSRSVAAATVIEAARSLFRAGYREIVLTGVNVGDWGRDLDPPSELTSLLRGLLAVAGPNRVRLNSLEPLTVTDGLIRLMAEDPRLAPHLQVPLQSGSPDVLRAMRRNYRLEAYLDRLVELRAAVPDVGLGADVIVGFPGEDDRLFEETYRFIAESPLNYLHVFSWSPRPGTPAAEMPGRAAPTVVRERSRRLRELAQELGLRFRRGFVGRRLDVVVLTERAHDQRLRALTGNFIEVSVPPDSARTGQLARVEVTEVTSDDTQAVVCGVPTWSEVSSRTAAALSTTARR